MTRSHRFKHIHRRQPSEDPRAQPGRAGLQALLRRSVVKPFTRISDVGVAIVLLEPAGTDDAGESLVRIPAACERYVGSEYCRTSWRMQLAHLKRRREAHWHTCDFGMFCAMVPVVHQGHCLAAIRLACPAATHQADFDRHVELLDILVENFVLAHASLLNRMVRASGRPSHARTLVTRSIRKPADSQPQPAHIVQAIRYVEKHLADPMLSIGSVACAMNLNPSYLSHFFVEHAGQRLGRFIVDRRLTWAKRLLATTDWQIKRIALQTGHAHANWFSRVFTEHTGMTPGAFRRNRRRPKTMR